MKIDDYIRSHTEHLDRDERTVYFLNVLFVSKYNYVIARYLHGCGPVGLQKQAYISNSNKYFIQKFFYSNHVEKFHTLFVNAKKQNKIKNENYAHAKHTNARYYSQNL